jgi:spermidine synthase
MTVERDGLPDLQTLARHVGAHGEVVLRRRTDGLTSVDELIVNGTFAMDSTETLSERALGEIAVGAVGRLERPARLLVGGLGLGYTVRELLDTADIDRLEVVVDVVEIERSLIDWAREGVTATLARVAADPRVRLHAADIGAVLAGRGEGPVGPWDAIVLDVDNGPDFLIHEVNADLYAAAGLRAAYAQLARAGTLAIWCQGPSPDLLDALRRLDPEARENRYSVARGERRVEYVIYTARRA